MKSTEIEMKTSIEGLSDRLEVAEERINQFENTWVGIMQYEEQSFR